MPEKKRKKVDSFQGQRPGSLKNFVHLENNNSSQETIVHNDEYLFYFEVA